MKDPQGFRQEARDLMRGVAGGLIFGTSVLFTMEVWFDGQIFSPGKLLVLLLSSLVLNIFFAYFAGLREHHSTERVFFAIDDGVTSLGLGLILSAIVLGLIGQLGGDVRLLSTLGKIVMEATIISIGVTFTNFKFSGRKKTFSMGNLSGLSLPSPAQLQTQQDISDVLAAFVGALVFSFNVAPTEEIVLIAAGMNHLELATLLLAEIVFAFVVLYASGLKDHVIYTKDSFFQGPLNETLITVAVSLIVSSLLMSTIGYAEISLASTIVLGLPASIGAAAGRLTV